MCSVALALHCIWLKRRCFVTWKNNFNWMMPIVFNCFQLCPSFVFPFTDKPLSVFTFFVELFLFHCLQVYFLRMYTRFQVDFLNEDIKLIWLTNSKAIEENWNRQQELNFKWNCWKSYLRNSFTINLSFYHFQWVIFQFSFAFLEAVKESIRERVYFLNFLKAFN